MTTYRITPYKHLQGTTWAWWAFRSLDFGGATPIFKIAKAGHYNLVSGEWLACWSQAADTDTWHQFDNLSIGASDIQFSNNSAFPAGMIYISALPMYPFSRVQRKVNEWSRNAKVGQTSSTTNFVVANMTARDANDGSGRTAPALPMYGMKITSTAPNTKNKAVLSSMQHPSETPGAFALEAAVDWLLGGSANANTLLDWFEFYVYPGRNCQGVWSGYFRVQPQNKTAGADWSTTGQWEEVDLLKPAIIDDIDNSADVMLDYHSYMDASDINGYCVHGDAGTGQYVYYAAAMETLDSAFEINDTAEGSGEENTLGGILRSTCGVDLYVTVENHGMTGRGISDWKTFGENTLKALYTMLIDGRFPNVP